MKMPKAGDIWLVKYPYITPGNMEKIRPAVIKGIIDDERILVQKLSTKKHKGSVSFKHPKMKRPTFLSNERVVIKDYNLVRYVGNLTQVKK